MPSNAIVPGSGTECGKVTHGSLLEKSHSDL